MTEKFTIFCEFQPNQQQPPPTKTQQQPDGSFYPSQANGQAPTDQSQNQTQSQAQCLGQQLSQQQHPLQQQSLQQQQHHNHHHQQQHPSKREPLGLRQASDKLQQVLALARSLPIENQSSQSSQASSVVSSQPSTSQTGVTDSNNVTTRRPTLVGHEEDQENDISMVSLGSDFMPSLTQGEMQIYNDQSFELDDGGSSFITSHSDHVYDSENGHMDSELTDSDLLIEDADMFDTEDDAVKQNAYNESLKSELAQAFKRHDDSQLFKTTVYIDDIDLHMKDLEKRPEARPLPNYLDFQDDIDSDKRAILVNWLVEVADEFELQTETLFICINIIDRFLSEMSVTTNNLQLLGVAAMFTASKYEEIYPPNLNQFVEVTDDCYTGKQIRQMEQLVLKALKFRISMPTITFFLNQIFAYNKFPRKVYDLAEYLCYLTLAVDQPFLEYLPSEIALASVILAAHEQGAADKISSHLLEAYNQSNLDQLERRDLPKGIKTRDVDRRKYTINKTLPFCIESLRIMQERAFNRTSNLPVDASLIERFRNEDKSCVASLKPPSADEVFSEA